MSTTQLATVPRRLLNAAVAQRLTAVTTGVGYYAQIGRALVPGTSVPKDPPPKSSTDPRVQPYFIFWPSAGMPGPDPDLGDAAVDGTHTIRVTAAGGDVDDVLALVDRIDTTLNRWTPTVTGLACGRVRPLVAYDAPLLTDRAVTPHRLYVPLQYQLTVTAS